MLLQNIQDKSPFVYVQGVGDSHHLHDLKTLATQLGCVEDLRSISFKLSHPGPKHTFDPINPLVGDPQAFNALFGALAGPLLHKLCLAQWEDGNLVDLAAFKSFLDLEKLLSFYHQEKFQSAKVELDQYFKDAMDFCVLDTCSTTQAARHAKHMSKAWNFYHVLEHSKLCSTDPDVDFRNLFKSGKYVCITLSALVKEPESFGFLSTLFAYLISASADKSGQPNANPEVIFDGVFDTHHDLGPTINRLSQLNTLFTLVTLANHRPDNAIGQIGSAARSAFILKAGPCSPPDALSALEIHQTDIRRQKTGAGYAWGNLAVMRKGKPYSLIGLAKAHLQHRMGL
jgi:hypothetical protein